MRTEVVPTGSIVVGIDGTPSSDGALDWAAAEAARCRVPLHIVHALRYQIQSSGLARDLDRLDDVVPAALTRVQAQQPGLACGWSRPDHGPVSGLVDASRVASTVVIGTLAHNAFNRAVLGSTSTEVIARAHCPVVVVHGLPPEVPATAPVVVGIDNVRMSVDVIDFAFQQARTRGVDLVAVHAWEYRTEDYTTGIAMWGTDREDALARETEVLERALAGSKARYPGLTVHQHTTHSFAADGLTHYSKGACLLVLGTRGRREVGALILGSVSQSVIRRAACPVAVLHTSGEAAAGDGSSAGRASASPGA